MTEPTIKDLFANRIDRIKMRKDQVLPAEAVKMLNLQVCK